MSFIEFNKETSSEELINVLESYKKDGYKSLSSDKIATFLELKFGGLHEAQEKIGSIEDIRNSFYSIQEILYS